MEKQNELLINESKSNNFSVKSNKQIEEMAKYICNACEMGNGFGSGCCEGNDYIKCGISIETAQAIYNAGYRKASEVAREIFEEIEEGVKAAFSALQFENNYIHKKVKHETLSSLMRFIKTVEKKYIGEDTNVHTNTEDGE
jgi:hypothetical protein